MTTATSTPSAPPASTAPSPPSARPFHHHSHSANTGLSASDNSRVTGPSPSQPSSNKYRASVDTAGRSPALHGGQGGSASANWRAVSPGRASTGGVGVHGLRPNSELLGASQGAGQGQGFQSAETDAIDRWFEDLQQYETTLEEMAAASLDANFKEELSAIEQWFRVLSEAERTAALYSLLQSSTQMQMRFFITVLQQMARQDPTQAALLSPAAPVSLESQMEAKLAALGFDSNSPASPAVRQFARQSLGVGAASSPAPDSLLSPNLGGNGEQPSLAQSTLANQRAKLKASSRTSAPANLLLSASNGLTGTGEGLKSPLWSKEETVRERSPSPRPKSTGTGANPAGSQSAQLPASASFLRSPNLNADFENQLSPLVGGSWASMVNTPLVPMFGKGDTMEQGNFGGIASPNLDSVGQRLGNWSGQQSVTSPNPNNEGGIVLDDVRKFRRSARVSGGVAGGALSGMYEAGSNGNNGSSSTSAADARANSAATAQKRVQDQLQAVQQLKNLQQSAINLGLGGSGTGNPPASPNTQNGGGVNGSRVGSNGALSSPGLQQTAMAAQQNWRNANAAHLPPTSPNTNNNGLYAGGGVGNGQAFSGLAGGDAFAHPGGLGVTGLTSPSLGGGFNGGQQQQVQAQAQAQLASLLALQQQMMQQQQQLQSLANGVGLGGLAGLGGGQGAGGMGGMNPGLGMGGIGGMMSPGLVNQLSPRLGGGGGNGFGLGFGGMPSPRRSPRPHDRSPHLPSSRPSGDRTASGNPQQTPGSGQNPDEPLDMALLGDTPAWLRSLRLHKYTPNFEGVGWKEMVVMGDKGLEDKGVSALGARRKLLKVFEVVRAKTGIKGGDDASSATAASSSSSAGSPNAASSPDIPAHREGEEDGREE